MQEDWSFVERLPREEQEQWCSAATGADTQEVLTEGYSWEYQKFDERRMNQTHGPDDC